MRPSLLIDTSAWKLKCVHRRWTLKGEHHIGLPVLSLNHMFGNRSVYNADCGLLFSPCKWVRDNDSPIVSNAKNNIPRSVRCLHFTLPWKPYDPIPSCFALTTGWAIETSLSLSLSVAINLTLSTQLAKPHLGISLSHRRNSKVCFPSFNVSFCQTENGLKRFSKTVAKIRFKTPFLIS